MVMVMGHPSKILHVWQGVQRALLENYTDCCFTAIESLQEIFVRKLTRARRRKRSNELMNTWVLKGLERWLGDV